MLDKNVLLEAIIRMELPGALPPHGFHTVPEGTSAHCQEGFIPIMDTP